MGYESYEQKASRALMKQRTTMLSNQIMPGWYKDLRGFLCIVVHNRLVSIAVEDTGDFAVTVDAPDSNGDFAKHIVCVRFPDIGVATSLARSIVGFICNHVNSAMVDTNLEIFVRAYCRTK